MNDIKGGSYHRRSAAWNYARIAVQVDLTKPRLSKFQLQKSIQKVEYEGIHLVCFSCGCYGHKMDSCPALSSGEAQPEKDHRSSPKQDDSREWKDGADYVAWMVVQTKTLKPTKNVAGRKENMGDQRASQSSNWGRQNQSDTNNRQT